MVSEDIFYEACKKGFCYRKSIRSDKCKKEYKQKVCYPKYLRVEERRIQKNNKEIKKANEITLDDKKKDLEWEKVKELVTKRDKGYCRLLKILDISEWGFATQVLSDYSSSDLVKLDCAHCFGKGAFPELKYDSDNIVLMYRLFHARLDIYKNPVTGKSINKVKHEDWWKRIIGLKLWNELKNKIRKE